MRFYLFVLLAFLSPCAFSITEDSAAVTAQLQDYYFDAARRGDVPMLDTFIEAGYSLETRDSKGYTALILAAYHGQNAAVERLLAAGADACAQDLRGNTALMGAIFKGEVQMARTLLATCSSGTETSTPSRSRRASFAPSSSRARSTAPDRRRARDSCQRPRRMSVAMTLATSK